MELSAAAVREQPGLSVARDVRRLIAQAEKGDALDAEYTGHAYDVQLQAAGDLQARLASTALAAEIERRIDTFARTSATTNMHMRLVIADTMPDLPDHSPSQVSIYDGVQEAGSDFSQVIQRATIYGTVMTSVNITDLRAYFESGRKRHLLVYLGTDRQADVKALDKMLAILPAIMAEAGMSREAVAAVIAAIKTGDVPPAMGKMLLAMVRAAELRAAPPTPETRAAIVALKKEITSLVAVVQALPATALPRAFLPLLAAVPAIVVVLASPAPAPAPAPAAPVRNIAPPPADNDNRAATPPATQPVPEAAIPAVKTLVTELRALARDRTLPPAQRRAVAQALLDLRAATKVQNPAPARLATGIARVMALSAIVTMPLARAVIIPALARFTATLTTLPSFPSLAPQLMAAITRAMPAAAAAILPPGAPMPPVLVRIMASPNPVALAARVLARALPASVQASAALPPAQAVKTAAVTQRPSPLTPMQTLRNALTRAGAVMAAPVAALAAAGRVMAPLRTAARPAPASLENAGKRLTSNPKTAAPERWAESASRIIAANTETPRAKEAAPVKVTSEQAPPATTDAKTVTPPRTETIETKTETTKAETVTPVRQAESPAQPQAAPETSAPTPAHAPSHAPTHAPNHAPGQDLPVVPVIAATAPTGEAPQVPTGGKQAASPESGAPQSGPTQSGAPEAGASETRPPQSRVQESPTAEPQAAQAGADKAEAQPGGPQFNPDGSLKDCCRGQFEKVAGLAATDAAPAVERDVKGGIIMRDAEGQVAGTYTAQEVAQNESSHAAISTALDRQRAESGQAVDTKTQAGWDSDLARMMSAPADRGAKTSFDHVCGDGCTHGAPKQQAAQNLTVAETASVARDTDVTLTAAKPEPANDKKGPAWLRQRNLRPA